MRKRAARLSVLLLTVCALLAAVVGIAVPVQAEEGTGQEETELVEIYTPEDLLSIAEDPAGSYILMADLDMSGVAWKSLDFCGSFDGNGHAILNLYLLQPGDEKPDSCDGNRKLYETSYVGLFGTLRNAEVKDLQLRNVRGQVEIDTPCFMAGIAGYAENSTITDCTVTGCLELRAHDRMFGIGGVVGYGSGTVERCKVDVTLICTDTDAATRDEQFLGGVYATGFMDVKDCQIVIDGYVSEHGYVHNGGIVGMYMEYPLGVGHTGWITGNSVTGKITFYEDNPDRRAYCKAFVGEALVNRYYLEGNTESFQRDERWDKSAELRPEMCAEPVYTQTVIAPGCDTYGYTQYQCGSCGYTYTDHYTLFEHTVTVWTVKEEPTTEKEGLSVAYCDHCGLEFQRSEPMLAPESTVTVQPTEEVQPPQTEQPTQPTEQTPGQDAPPHSKSYLLILFLAAVVVLTAAIIVMLRGRSSGGKYQRRK